VTGPLRLRIGLIELVFQSRQVYSEVCYTLAFLLPSFFIALSHVKAPVDGICNAVIYKSFEVGKGIGERRCRTGGIAI
jgi:hypothetical protein